MAYNLGMNSSKYIVIAGMHTLTSSKYMFDDS